MDCENCENYKPKKDSETKELVDKCNDYCVARDCEECEMPFIQGEHRKCPVWKIAWGHIR